MIGSRIAINATMSAMTVSISASVNARHRRTISYSPTDGPGEAGEYQNPAAERERENRNRYRFASAAMMGRTF
jgi:hypothetical protein